MDWLLLLTAVYLLSAAQLAIAPALAMGGVTPHLAAAAAGVWMLLYRDERCLVAAALWGLAADLAGSGRMGVAMAAYVLVAFSFLRLRPAAPLAGWLSIAASTLAVLAATLLEMAARAALGDQPPLGAAFLNAWLAIGVYSACIAAGLMFLVRSTIAIFGTETPAGWSWD